MKNSAIDSYYWRHYIENNIGLTCPYFQQWDCYILPVALHKRGSGQQTSEQDIWVGPIFVWYSHLILCEASKSSAGHTLLTCPPVPTLFPFSTNRSVYIEFVLRFPLFPY